MANTITRATLKDIQANDPDGRSWEPTAADYAAHRDWAIAKYGEAAWKQYYESDWDYTPTYA